MWKRQDVSGTLPPEPLPGLRHELVAELTPPWDPHLHSKTQSSPKTDILKDCLDKYLTSNTRFRRPPLAALRNWAYIIALYDREAAKPNRSAMCLNKACFIICYRKDTTYFIPHENTRKPSVAQVFSCEFCEISKNSFFCRTPLDDCFYNEENKKQHYLSWTVSNKGVRDCI